MQLFFKTLAGKTVIIDAEPEDTIEIVKFKIQEVEGVLASQQRLIFAGKEFEDSKTLADYNPKDRVIHLVYKLDI
jgi:hypothetical protein